MSAAPTGSGPVVAVRVDASDQIGGGHLMRCLALADALTVRGAQVRFVCSSVTGPLARRVLAAEHDLSRIDVPRDPVPAEGGLLPHDVQERDAAATVAACETSPDWFVVDHYRLDGTWQRAVATATAARVLVLDDLADRVHDGDLLVDQTAGRQSRDYAALVPARCTVLTGTRYALLRDEFARLRPRALVRRRQVGSTRRILVALGVTDLGGVTGAVVPQLLDAGDSVLDVVVGPAAPSLPALQELAAADPGVALHVDSHDMGELMLRADLAVGAAGTSSWERSCLGLPTVTLVLADNQRFVAQVLGEVGAAHIVDRVEDVGHRVRELLDDVPVLARMSAAAFALCDGRGADRVAEAVVGGASTTGPPTSLALSLRPARPRDSEQLWLWRNDPISRRTSKTLDPVVWSDHAAWFSRVLADESTTTYLVQEASDPVAVVRFGRADGAALVSINVSPHARGRGIGKRALALACEAYERARPGTPLVAEVRPDNVASLSIFRAVGFTQGRGHGTDFVRFSRPAGKPAD
jgi:UDP-2,4-diacetamido-2,4,6-trideoxy-beta-L-altropyranose hydrolase